MAVRVVQIGDHAPEFTTAPASDDSLFMFEMSKARDQVPELKLLAEQYSRAINKVEVAAEFTSLPSLVSAAIALDDIISGTIAMRENLEIIITKARSAR